MIYCIEDDNSARELMLYALKASGFECKGFKDAALFFEELKMKVPDLILLDIMLPDIDGVEILKALRATKDFAHIPVIMATAKGTEYDKVLCLDLGADDYLAKPFGMMEMVSRIKAVLRRVSPKPSEEYIKLGDISLDPNSHTVKVNGKITELTYKEYELLSLFMKHPRKAYSREELLELIWGTDYLGETRTVDVHIGTLRTKLNECGSYIKTVRGVGYRMEESA